MRPTRRFWALAVLALGWAASSVLLSEPLFLSVPLGIALWGLAHQVAFVRRVTRLGDARAAWFSQSVSPETVVVGNSTLLAVRYDPSFHSGDDLVLSLPDRPGVTLDGEREHALDALASGTQRIEAPLRVDVAGEFELPRPTLRARSPHGLFETTISVGSPVTVTGEPRAPRDVHVGAGGQRISVAAGEHGAEQGISGFEPGELREYLPGDPTNRIDWKATARLGEPHVRDVEAETTRRTRVVVDCRPQMLAGPDGRTKLDFAREVAVWLTELAASHGDPLSVSLVREGAIEETETPATTGREYRRERQRLHALRASERDSPAPVRDASGAVQSAGAPTEAVRASATDLTGSDAFAETLRPYVADLDAHVERVSNRPLFRAVADADGAAAWTVLVTDDSNREALLESVRAAAGDGSRVSAFVLPSALFAPDGLTDLDAAYHEYVDFEEYRQRLDAVGGATAFELGPADRLAAVVDAAARARHRE